MVFYGWHLSYDTNVNSNGSLYRFLELFPFLAYFIIVAVTVKLKHGYKNLKNPVTVTQKNLYQLARAITIAIPILVVVYIVYGITNYDS